MRAYEIRPSLASLLLNGEGPFDVLARARQLEAAGHDVIHLELGEADEDTPEHVKRAGVDAIENNRTRYVQSNGIAELRDAVAHTAAIVRNVRPFSPEEVVIGPGLKAILWNVLSALLDPGDEIVFADPAYTSYRACAEYLRAIAVPVALRESLGFRFDIDSLEAAFTSKTKVLLLNSPHNPTGGILTREDIGAIADLAIRYDVTVVSDEIYSRNIYTGEFVSIASVDGMRERTIILDGFSKTYSMTGWRLGYGIMPKNIAKTVSVLGQNMYSCTAPFVQDAGLAALLGPDDAVKARVERLRRHRDAMVAGLNTLPGITCRVPDGAFYAFPNVSSVTSDDRKLAEFFLEAASVAGMAGSSFGTAGIGHIRFSYATSMDSIELAVERMRIALGQFRAG
jgi:aspartate/methionine/tyrosine aminotransferase